MKRLLALTSLLVACSGSTGYEILSDTGADPTTSVSFAPEEPDSGSQRKIVSPDDAGEQDAGEQTDSSSQQDAGELVDSSTPQDAGSTDSGQDSGSLADAGQDSGQDAGQPVEPPRYGVLFDGSQGQRVISNLPADMAGQKVVTLEGYFRYDVVSAQGFLFQSGAGPYAAVVTTGAHMGEVATCLIDGSPCVYSGNQLTLGVWHHLAVTLDNGSLCLYLDGGEKGCVATNLLAFPQVATGPGIDTSYRLSLGTNSVGAMSSKSTVDEFRVSYTRRYMGAYAVPKRLTADLDAKLTLAFDEGMGPSSPPATLYSGASWVEVAR